MLADPVFGGGRAGAAEGRGRAKAWLDLFRVARAGGWATRMGLRRFMRAVWDLARVVTHSGMDRDESVLRCAGCGRVPPLLPQSMQPEPSDSLAFAEVGR